MSWGSRSFLVLLLVLFATVTSFAQSSQSKDPAYNLWLIRSQTITTELLKDASDLDSLNRALLLAGLAQRWWQENPDKAGLWLTSAIETVESVPNKETQEERRKRVDTARQLLHIVVPLDQRLSKRLVKVLRDDSRSMADAERSTNAQALIDAAVALVDSDPRRAAELGTVSLQLARSPNIIFLIFALRSKDPRLSDGLLAQVLTLTSQRLEDLEMLHALTRATFPEQMRFGSNAGPPSERLRTELLLLQLKYLRDNPINAESRNSVCIGVISFVLPLMTEFERRLPQQASAARQAVSQCESLSPLSQQIIDDARRAEPLNTEEDLLNAAEKADDLKVRTVYQYRAAMLAKEKKQYEKALAILDSMSKEGRDFMGESWRHYRWDWASLLAIDYYTKEQIDAMHRTIYSVPDDLKAFAQLAFVDRLPVTRNRDTDPTFSFLSEARKGLDRSFGSEREKYSWYFALLVSTLKYQPIDGSFVLKDAIAALNRALAEDKSDSHKEEASFDTSGVWKSVSRTMIEMDEYVLREAVARISSASTRSELRLELLAACLERMRSKDAIRQ